MEVPVNEVPGQSLRKACLLLLLFMFFIKKIAKLTCRYQVRKNMTLLLNPLAPLGGELYKIRVGVEQCCSLSIFNARNFNAIRFFIDPNVDCLSSEGSL